jgi:Na+-driven multidrug efflux pump
MQDRREVVLEAPLRRALWSLSWPLMLSNQLAMFAGIVAIFWFGHLLGETALAVESLFRPVALIVTFVLGSTSVGASVLVSRSVGANDGKGMSLAAASLTLTCLLCAAMVVIVGPLAPWISDLLAGGLSIERPMLQYILGWLLAATPAFALNGVLLDVVSATGDTKYSIVRVVVDLLFMAALAPVLIHVLGFGIVGGPLSEGIGALALAPVLWFALVRHRASTGLGEVRRSDWGVRWDVWKEVLKIGFPVQFGRFAYFISTLILMHFLTRDGAASIAGYGIATALVMIASSTTLAVAEAGAILVGQCIGAGRHERARRGISATLFAGALVMAVFIVATMFDRQLIALFTSDREITDAASHALSIIRWATIGIAAWQILLQAFAAHGATVRASMYMVLGEGIGLAVGLAWPSSYLDGACVAIVVSNLIKGGLLVWLYVTGKVIDRPATAPA